MSIIRATRQKGGSTFPLTSHVSLFFIRSSFGTHLATKPRATEELQTSLLSNQKESRRNNNSYHGKIKNIRKGFSTIRASFCLPFFLCSLTVSSEIRKRLAISEIFNPYNVSCITRRHWGGSCSIAAIRLA